MEGAANQGKPPAPEDPRVRLAAERTLLAWVRTGLALMGFGFVVARFGLFLRELAVSQGGERHSHGLSLWLGTALVFLGVVVTVLAAVEHTHFLRRLERGEPAGRWPLGVIVAALLAVFGAIMAGYLIVVGT
jgi:putative membrane protein